MDGILTRDMLDAAGHARHSLAPIASRIVAFLGSRILPDGGFANRAGRSDLYYTLFGLQSLLALGEAAPDATRNHLASFGAGTSLDFIHATCLARAWALIPGCAPDIAARTALLRRIETFRCDDGGYHVAGAGLRGSVYGCFLARLAYEDLAATMPEPQRIIDCIADLRTPDHAFANEPGLTAGTTTATSAAVVLLRHVVGLRDDAAIAWLQQQIAPAGGFLATPGAPVADLMSTATAAYALAFSGVPVIADAHDQCLAFVASLFDDCGGFRAIPFDTTVDCEYTFHGLLALGALMSHAE